MKKILFKIHTLGCKVNQYESEKIRTELCRMGFQESGKSDECADICIINTCAVTSSASRKARQAIRRFRTENPASRIYALGCAVEIKEKELTGLDPGVIFIGTGQKENLPRIICGDLSLQPVLSGSPPPPGKTRAFLKVQDGCDSFCSYCIIPYLRGRSRSRPVKEVLNEIESIESAGYLEAVLTGIHLGNYGRDLSEDMDLPRLLKLILQNSGIPRIRISSLEPMDSPERIISMMAENPRICRHLHLPLQHASDKILKAMNRKYTLKEYDRIIQKAVATIPGMAITTDILTGFPGESGEDFRILYDYVKSAPFSRLHVFPYSSRPGTVADRMEGKLPKAVKQERLRILQDLGAKMADNFARSFIGTELSVLPETELKKAPLLSFRPGDRFFQGHSDNYIETIAIGKTNLAGRIIKLPIEGIIGDKLYGKSH